MTGRFETLIYTDCRPGQGLQGTAGLQFQARSAGADGRAMSVVQRNLLYEPPPSWMRERRPVGEYPPSFAHVWDGLLATAAGVYLGRESVGGREGNQLTHSITTSDPASYRTVRPAQLFGAPFWTDRPAPSTECPPLEPGWRPGPFGVTEAQAFVRAQPQGAEMLSALLAALWRSQLDRTRRVLFVADEAVGVLRWVTAATLLLPQREALRIGFKIFTLNPAYAPQHVLAVHPEWSAAGANLDNDQGYAIFDLVRHAWSQGEAAPAARLWADLFLGEDPFDVVDAVEVAAASGLAGEAATIVALAAILRRRPDERGAPELVSWLRQGPPQLVRRYGPEIVDLLVEHGPEWPTEVLRQLHEASGAATFPHRGPTVRLALIEAELAEALGTGLVQTGPVSPPGPEFPGSDEEAAARALLTDTLRSADPVRFDAALRVCGRFGIQPEISKLQPSLRRFVLDWAEHPDRPYDPQLWAGRAEIEQLLRAELTERLAADPRRSRELGDLWWDVLLREPMRLDGVLDEVVVSAALRYLPPQQQEDLVEQCLAEAARGPDPIGMVNRTAAVLWADRVPTPGEARTVCRLVPRGMPLDPRVFALLAEQLVQDRPPPDRADVAAGRALLEHGIWRPPNGVVEIIEGHAALEQTIELLPQQKPDIAAITVLMARASPSVVDGRLPELLETMLVAPAAAAVAAVLAPAPVLTEPLARRLRTELSRNSEPAHVAMAFVLVHALRLSPVVAQQLSPTSRNELDRIVSVWLSRCSQKRLDLVTRQIEELGPLWSDPWQNAVRAGRRRGVGRFRPGRGR
ncbi:GTPase-associated protein 1-related protein [Plantactinospora sp. WMMB782]|uniref:GTPase-associated protein 1-related protein n=1 Tax=Plantactinospora sp. WMMB782 TaxID=3404121 RepID=UPI003B941C23